MILFIEDLKKKFHRDSYCMNLVEILDRNQILLSSVTLKEREKQGSLYAGFCSNIIGNTITIDML